MKHMTHALAAAVTAGALLAFSAQAAPPAPKGSVFQSFPPAVRTVHCQSYYHCHRVCHRVGYKLVCHRTCHRCH
jgi:hypothetical protein